MIIYSAKTYIPLKALEVDLEVNTVKTEDVSMAHQQNPGQNHNIKNS
jgi:hypothetical protein